MRRFLLRLLVWSLVSLLAVCAVDTVLYYSGYINKNKIGHEVQIAISKSKNPASYRFVVLGDSVGLQYYDTWTTYDNLVSLASNMGVSLAGQFFLLNNYVKTHGNALPEKVFLILTYQSLNNDLTTDLTYPYFLKNFYRREYRPFYNESLWCQVRKTPFYWTATWPIFRTSNIAFHYSISSNGDHVMVSKISETYLHAIEKIAEENQIDFALLIAPIRESAKEEFLALLQQGLDGGEIRDPILERALQEVVFLPDSLYRDDVHFNEDDIPYDYLDLLN